MATNGVLPTETEAALVVWVNSFPLSDRVKSLAETNDGQAFWEMLCEINGESFTGTLPTRKQSETAREQNLHFIHKHISSYLDEQGAIYPVLSDDDIKNFASEGLSTSTLQAGAARSPAAAVRANRSLKFLKLILLIMITPPNADIVNQIQNLPQQTQQVIYRLIQEIDPSQSSSEDEHPRELNGIGSDQARPEDGINSSPAWRVDRELELEAQQAELQSKLNHREREVAGLKAEKENLHTAYERLQETNAAFRQRESEQEERLNRLASAHNDMDQMSMRELEAKISHQEEIISSREFQISEHQSHEAELQRRLTKLNGMADEFQKLQDEFHIQKADLFEQTKKANAGDKYKHKVQAFQSIEKERDTLRQQLEEARPKLKAYEDLRRDNSRLVKENREISSTLSQSEIGNSELRETKQGVIAENDRLRRDLKALREAYTQSQQNNTEFADRSDDSDIQSSPTVVDGGLESELAVTSTQEDQMQVARTLLHWQRSLTDDRKSRILDLERQLSQLAEQASEKEFKIVALQRQLDGARELSADQSAKLLRLHEDVSALESSMTEVRQGHPVEGSVSPKHKMVDLAHTHASTQAFRRLQDELKEERRKRTDAEEKLSEANNNCELVGKPKLEMLQQAKRQGSITLMHVQGELDDMKTRYSHLQQEFDKQFEERNQAWRESHEVLVAKAEGEAKAAADNQTLQEMAAMILNATKDKSTDLNASVERTLVPLISTNRELVAEKQQVDKRLISLDETIKRQEATITDLETRLGQCTNASNHPGSKATTSPSETTYTQNLERELKLMASAYHNLAGRLQMNNVVLQRRAEAPKSWLGRQRKALEGVSGLTR